jgi:hypothetical protein
VLVERIGMGGDLDPFAAAGDHRKHGHVVYIARIRSHRRCGRGPGAATKAAPEEVLGRSKELQCQFHSVAALGVRLPAPKDGCA